MDLLLAQTTTPAKDPASTLIENSPPWIGTGSAIGILVWFLWHTTTKTIPQKDSAHKDYINTLIQSHSEQMERKDVLHCDAIKEIAGAVKEQTLQFREELQRERMGCEERDRLHRESLHKLSGAVGVLLQKRGGEGKPNQ